MTSSGFEGRTAGAQPPLTTSDVFGVLERHAHKPSSYLALNQDTRHFTVPGSTG